MSKVMVLYKTLRGVVAFDKRKPIFQHKNSKTELKEGLGVIVENSFVDKGNYAFAEMRNIESVFPDVYLTVDYFENVGVPAKIYKGEYGGNVFIKEEYPDKTFIKALDAEGNILIQEIMKSKKNALNISYCRLDNAVVNWEDITDSVVSSILESIKSKKCDINLGNPYILYALKPLYKKKVVKLENGVILAFGNHETLAIWGNGNQASMAWLGRSVEDIGTMVDIKEDVKSKMLELGIII